LENGVKEMLSEEEINQIAMKQIGYELIDGGQWQIAMGSDEVILFVNDVIAAYEAKRKADGIVLARWNQCESCKDWSHGERGVYKCGQCNNAEEILEEVRDETAGY